MLSTGSREHSAAAAEPNYYSNKEGMAFFFNYINGCNKDVSDLKARLTYLGWGCRDVEVNTKKDIQKELEKQKESYSGTIIVFFFGYGYKDQMFLGTSTEVSLSYEVFSQEINKFQSEGNSVILFTNTCFKQPTESTYEYVVTNDQVTNVFHFRTEIIGTCDQGSLMTHLLLNEMEYSYSDFAEEATHLSMKINRKTEWKGGEYYAHWKIYGVSSNISVPSLSATVNEDENSRRDSDQLEKWRRITSPPVYFERVEADANIYGGASQAAHLGLVEPIQNAISRFDALRGQCNNCVIVTEENIDPAIPDHCWPVGLLGSIQNPSSCMDPELLRVSTPAKDSLLDIKYLAKNVFNLSEEAVSSIIGKKTSLLYEVSNVCNTWQKQRPHLTMPEHVPPEYAPATVLIAPDERFLEVKRGVYYVLQRGTVIKFMTDTTDLPDFVMENTFGYGLQGNIKGTVGVIATCPEAFCVEMEFAGVSLESVVKGDINCSLNHPRNNSSDLRDQQQWIQYYMAHSKMAGILCDVRMLQATGRLPTILQKTCKVPIADSYSAVGVTNMMRKRLLDELPFLTAEIINIITRLSQQGLVNPDIKSDNFVIDGVTGQPKMIDFGLILPTGRRDNANHVSSTNGIDYSDCPQAAPEFLNGGKCQEATMTYSLSYMINDILNTLVSRTGDTSALTMSVNVPFQSLMAEAYAQDYEDRPRAYLMAPLVAACFPFQDNIAKLFDLPKHNFVSK